MSRRGKPVVTDRKSMVTWDWGVEADTDCKYPEEKLSVNGNV